jgi:polysaccharide biosynthesis/export protein
MKRVLMILGCMVWVAGPAAADGAAAQGPAAVTDEVTQAGRSVDGNTQAGKPAPRQEDGSRAVPGANEEYLLGPEDKIRVMVVGHPEYSLETTVTAAGRIPYPIPGGELYVAGRTREEARALIAEALKFDLRNPTVAVEVSLPRPRPVYITGMMASTLEWQRGWHIRDALAKTGGLKGKPELTRATLRHPNGERVPVDLKKIFT